MSQDLFSLPAYVFRYNISGRFEYILFNDNSYEMHYIFLDEIDLDNVVFDKALAPTKRIQNSDLKENIIIWWRGSYSHSKD